MKKYRSRSFTFIFAIGLSTFMLTGNSAFAKTPTCDGLSVLQNTIPSPLSPEEKLAEALSQLRHTEGSYAAVVSAMTDFTAFATRHEKLPGSDQLHDAIAESYRKFGITVDPRKLEHDATLARSQPNLFTHLLIYRSSAEGEINDVAHFNGLQISKDAKLGNVTPDEAKKMVQSTLDDLYKQYDGQGAYRAKEVEGYRAQDNNGANYTTHFVSFTDAPTSGLRPSNVYEKLKDIGHPASAVDKKVGHLQLQVSDSLDKPLNTEGNTLETLGTNPVKRKARERVGDLGRGLNILDEELSPATQAHLELAERERSTRFPELVGQVLAWGVHSADLDKMIFQCNETVLKKMKFLFGENNITDVIPFKNKNYEKSEYIAVMSRQQMENAEERMFIQERLPKLEELDRDFNSLKATEHADGFTLDLQPSALNQNVYRKLMLDPIRDETQGQFSDTYGALRMKNDTKVLQRMIARLQARLTALGK